MRFKNQQKNRLYKLYREDDLNLLKKRIEEIKQRKNQHKGGGKDKASLPSAASGFGFSREQLRSIEKQNQRLNSKIKKMKENHSSYYIKKQHIIRAPRQTSQNYYNTKGATSRSALASGSLLGIVSDRKYAQTTADKISQDTQQKNGISFIQQVKKIYELSAKQKDRRL